MAKIWKAGQALMAYNEERPHRARGRNTLPDRPDKVDTCGKATPRSYVNIFTERPVTTTHGGVDWRVRSTCFR